MAEADDIPVLTTNEFRELVIESSRPVLVYCYLKDSGLCSIKFEEFKRIAHKLAERVKAFRLDIGRSKDLAFEYRVLNVPAVLYFNQGEVTERWSNINLQDSVEALIEKTMGGKFDRLPAGIVHVTESNFKQWSSDHRVVTILNFWKGDHEPSWMLLADFKELADKYKDKIRFAVCNFDESRDLATQFRVSNVPTMIFLKRGEPADRLIGIQSRYAVERIIRTVTEE